MSEWFPWSDDVIEAAMTGARQAHRNGLESLVELDDVQQEAHIFIATKPAEVQRSLDAAGLTGVMIRVRSAMGDVFHKQHAAQGRQVELLEERDK